MLLWSTVFDPLQKAVASTTPVAETPSRGEQVFVRFMQSLGKNYARRKTVTEYTDEASLSVRHFLTSTPSAGSFCN